MSNIKKKHKESWYNNTLSSSIRFIAACSRIKGSLGVNNYSQTQKELKKLYMFALAYYVAIKMNNRNK
ncbi:hypothetical protein PIROE2DRAFT_5738 [Piromyces sp. E2]|nr:hypothetical protein PIROE2DRAFT_5738 [Piromyces sp. E2]|eukprot:OUM66995.1 hypothetical protein PIROE2DRAFT_5738 [Piromyces sp. E2]